MSLRRWVGAAWAAAGLVLLGLAVARGAIDDSLGGIACLWGSLCAVLGLIAPGIAFAWTEE
jgi:hypothetical protein